MDRNIFETAADLTVDAVKSVGTFVYDNAGVLAAITGVLALIPPLTPFLAPVSVGLGVVAAAHSAQHGDSLGLALDIAAIVPGVGAMVRGGRAATGMARAVDASVHARWLEQMGRIGPDAAASISRSATRRYVVAADLEASAHRLDQAAAGFATIAAVRGQLLGGEHEHEEPNPLEYHEPRPKPVRPLIPSPAHP
jgi:hypothetical protein